MSQNASLIIEGLSFKFQKQGNYFFKDLSASFEAGVIHFIRGSNGSGKSTLFRLLQGKVYGEESAHGQLVVEGKQFNYDGAANNHPSQLSTIKMVQQKFDTMVADQLTFHQNLQLANMNEFPGLSLLPDHKPLPVFLSRFHLSLDTPVHLLSGGQRQILAILMALQKPAEILLLDEPTAALDDQNAAMVMQFLHDLVQSAGLTILIICHDKELVYHHARGGHFEICVQPKTGLRSMEFVAHKI